MYDDKKISVVISTFNEKESIREFINACFKYGYADEVIVVNNNAVEGTDSEVSQTKAKMIYEKKQGYGFGYRKGLKEAKGDYIIMTEGDGTFNPKDFMRLIVYARDFDIVLGSRTANHSIIEGANMGAFLKWGNWAVAKLIEVLFLTTQLDDVGCTTRLINRNALRKIEPFFTVGNSHFGLEMTLLTVISKLPFVTIPLNYYPRIGKSSVTGSFIKTLQLGFTMIFFCLISRFRFFKNNKIRNSCN
jgi:glycosyltransferase involved in cell wall biosynthesis